MFVLILFDLQFYIVAYTTLNKLLAIFINKFAVFLKTIVWYGLNGREYQKRVKYGPRTSVSTIRLHTYRRAIYRIFLLYEITSRDVRKRTVIRRILRVRKRTVDHSQTKSCGRYIVGTLTNKANIIIGPTILLIAFPLTPKCMTLNGHFASNFHYCEVRTPFENLFLHTYH